MFQTAISGSFSTQLKVSEVQRLAIWIYKLLNLFMVSVGGRRAEVVRGLTGLWLFKVS